MKQHKTTTLTLALGSAIAAGLAGAPAAADSTFSAQALGHGYKVAAADKAAEGKCGEGKCGAAMMGESQKTDASKASIKPKSQTKTQAQSKAKVGEGKCGSKAKEGACGGAKAAEGKCGEGEGKCGAAPKK